jgi:hypothetical protein
LSWHARERQQEYGMACKRSGALFTECSRIQMLLAAATLPCSSHAVFARGSHLA